MALKSFRARQFARGSEGTARGHDPVNRSASIIGTFSGGVDALVEIPIVPADGN